MKQHSTLLTLQTFEDTTIMETVQFTEDMGLTELMRLKESKLPGPYEIPAKILKELSGIGMNGRPSHKLSQNQHRSTYDDNLRRSDDMAASPSSLNTVDSDTSESFGTSPADHLLRQDEFSTHRQLADIRRTLHALYRHVRASSRRQLWLMESHRRLRASIRALEALIDQRPAPSTEVAVQPPENPVIRPLRSAADFQQLNARLADDDYRNQLASYLVYLGGQTVDDFVKRIFYALFDDEICIHVNFKGKKLKQGLFGSKIYELITGVFARWNAEGHATLFDLESALTKRLKRSLDAYGRRLQKRQTINQGQLRSSPGSSPPPPYSYKET
nr:unnamed protein product [Spirometra erinaceieuropaei]